MLIKNKLKKELISMSDIIERLYGDEIRAAVEKNAKEVAKDVRKECRINFVLKFINKGIPKDLVSECMDVPISEIDEILANNASKTNI